MDESMAERDADGVRLMHDAYTRWANMPPVMVKLERRDAWVVMMALQAAVTHPGIAGSAMAGIVENAGRHLQEGLCDHPELYALAEAGWNRAADVAPEGGR
ncbi:hypothetical protein ABZ383_26470 [Streptomyces sp. NPDC005900]|uniref:hypothetical protein n=1 Tax=Streptomyces sp. NPDC005900 TaxID=3154569 RepID=UPI0033F653CB